ncbi:E3 ubiquitin-protein ligase At1g63170-like [Macadamia integrifolia]|uniref:E3 ubiquitin-protein ligase At1g63170-like n=1 Tax=Macadamia integrifolia TaxID=60698 RepID=UPI001C4F0231|nr:E3 ubiquitin-protein ligase At1g63170-like [Macadamia integrifolia]
MNTRYYSPPDSLYGSGIPFSFQSISSIVEDDQMAIRVPNGSARVLPSSFLMRTAMRISRASWFSFLRRVFHYQNGSRSDLGSNPFNSGSWITLEFVALAVQMMVISLTLLTSKEEKPVWPLKIWIFGYAIGCLFTLPLLYWRFRHGSLIQGNSDLEQQRSNEDSRSHLMNKSRTFLELFFAIWFVIGNIWVFDSRFGSFNRAPKLHVLCMSLLAWNAVSYSFPFMLFLLLCCFVPLISKILGYNMNMGSEDRGASDDQISHLPSWKYKQVDSHSGPGDAAEYNSDSENENLECCICLARYKDKEEVRQLPCSHIFHQSCVDQWLRIISSCPLCKQDLRR